MSEPSDVEQIKAIADPLIEAGASPFEVRAHVFVATGIMIGPGGHSDPCQPPICRYCGACGLNSGHGGRCPNIDPHEIEPVGNGSGAPT